MLDLLEDQDKAAFEAHLATCESCAAELRTLSPVAGMLSGLEPVHVLGQLHSAADSVTGVTGTVGLVAKAWEPR